MKDMLGQSVSPGDLFLIPGGNVRYGGLVLEVGIVLSMTEKRLKTLITRFDKIKLKPTTKTSTKVLKVPAGINLLEVAHRDFGEEGLFYENPAIIALQDAFQTASNVT